MTQPEHILRAYDRHASDEAEHEAYLERRAHEATRRITELYHDPEVVENADWETFEDLANDQAHEVFGPDYTYDLGELISDALPKNHRFR